MGGKLTIKNNDSTEFTIEHKDGSGSKLLTTKDFKYIRDTIKDLATIDNPSDGDVVLVKGYHSINDGGGGLFIYHSDEPKTNHNGGTVIDATKTFPNDWSNQTELESWFSGDNTGNGCWKRVCENTISVKWFGAKGDGLTDDTLALTNTFLYFESVLLQDGDFILSDTILLNQKHNIEFKNARIIYKGNSIAFDLYTDNNNNLDFKNHPIIMNANIVGNENAVGGIRINSTVDVVIGNYEASGFTGDNASALIFRNVAYGDFQGFCETYNVYGFASNFNTNGIKFEVDGGKESFGYGYIQGKITPKIGDEYHKSKLMDVQTTQLYNTSIDLSVWGNGYCDGIVIGNPNKYGRIYWCNIYIRGEYFNTENYSFDLTYGEVFGCTGFANVNNGYVKNPNNNRLEIYGQYQRTNYGNSIKKINGVDTKLTPLVASFQVEDAFNGKPEGGFGIAHGYNMTCPIVWMRDADYNSFRVVKAGQDSEPATDNPMFEVRWDGSTITNNKAYAKSFATKELSFTATGSTTTTYVVDIEELTGHKKGAFIISANATGADTDLSIIGLCSFAEGSGDIIAPVATLITEDYNKGSIELQTYGNIAAGTYSVGNGRKFQLVVGNDNSTDMVVYVTLTKIG
jgi:hypothetical protein